MLIHNDTKQHKYTFPTTSNIMQGTVVYSKEWIELWMH